MAKQRNVSFKNINSAVSISVASVYVDVYEKDRKKTWWRMRSAVRTNAAFHGTKP
jgi:hypothetical protein